MKSLSSKQKAILIAVFVVILAVVGTIAGIMTYRSTQEGVKNFYVEIVSERDNYSEEIKCKSEEEFLGQFLRTFESCQWQESDYGIYITGFEGMAEDTDNQYWWCVIVNGEASTTGADEIPLAGGDTYRFELKQGW